MGKEIERKYLVTDNSYQAMAIARHSITQGYLCREPKSTVRVRICDNRGFITVKGINEGISRDEWEYPVDAIDAKEMIERCCSGAVIVKTRYIVQFEGYRWEIDEFESPRRMIIAEVELPADDIQPPLPSFIGDEVTGDPRYYNSNITAG